MASQVHPLLSTVLSPTVAMSKHAITTLFEVFNLILMSPTVVMSKNVERAWGS